MKRVSDSQRVRDEMAQNQNAKPVQIAKRLGVSPSLVYNIRSLDNRRNGAHAKSAKPGGDGSHEPIVLAAKLIAACGSVSAAEQALSGAEQVLATVQH